MPLNCNGKITLDNLCITPQAQKTTSFRTLQQQYGDGYMARRQDGINPVGYTRSVSTPAMPFKDALDLEAELIENGTKPFSWTPPGEEDAQDFILDPVAWNWVWATPDYVALSFTLKRWYT